MFLQGVFIMPKMFMTPLKCLISIAILLFFVLGFSSNSFATDSNYEILDEFETEQFGDFQTNNEKYYYLDSVSFEEIDLKDSLFEDVGDVFDVTEKVKNEGMDMIVFLVNLFFKINIFLTNILISIVEFAYSFDFVNTIIEELQSIMQDISGVNSSGKIDNGGLFGNFALYIALAAALYALFMLIYKRQTLTSIASIFQTVICLAIAIMVLSNYSNFLTGINEVTTKASGLVMSITIDDDTEESGLKVDNQKDIYYDPEMINQSILSNLKDNLWGLFIDRPYLFLQYGTDRISEIDGGKPRVKKLLTKKPNIERREYVARCEANENPEFCDDAPKAYGNDLMLHSSLDQELAFTAIYMTLNAFIAIPILMLAFLLIVFQFWFMGIAFMAPFALLVGAFPGEYGLGVMKRYFIELALPLVLKVIVSFGILILFMLSNIVYENESHGYIVGGLLNVILFTLLFLLRKRIGNIFSAGSQAVQELRESIGNPLKKGAQGVTTTGGAIIGGVATGGAGVATGASIGNSVGKAVTGDGSAGEVAKRTAKVQRFHKLEKMKQEQKEEKRINSLPRAYNISDSSALSVSGFMDEHGFNNQDIDRTLDTLDKKGVQDVSLKELQESHANVDKEMQEKGETKEQYADLMANHILARQRKQEGKREANHFGINQTSDSTIGSFMNDKGFEDNTIDDTIRKLQESNVGNITMGELEHTHHKITKKLDKNNKLDDDYSTLMTKGILGERKTKRLKEQANILDGQKKSTIQTSSLSQAQSNGSKPKVYHLDTDGYTNQEEKDIHTEESDHNYND